jgi:hypothetical protein
MTITACQVDLNQGTTVRGEQFGYLAGDGGGFFFTWQPTLQETLGSVEACNLDGPGGLTRQDVVAFLREHLPTTHKGKRDWRKPVALGRGRLACQWCNREIPRGRFCPQCRTW